MRVTGGVPLRGEVQPSGAKNAVLKLMAACLLAQGPSVLSNVPEISDVETMVRLLSELGAFVRRTGPGEMVIDAGGPLSAEPPVEAVRSMRASVQVMGPLVARLGRVRLVRPGGCAIGERPLDFHLRGLEAMGARIREEGGWLTVEAPRLRGARIVLDFPSVGATENLMMAATLAQGRTEIHNAAREPEIAQLQEFLCSMGARVRGVGTGTVEVEGVAGLHGGCARLMPDRVETATWMLAAAITRGHVFVRGARADHVESVSGRLRRAGVEVRAAAEGVEVRAQDRRPQAVSVRTQPYPGFPTDVQPMWTALMTVASGTTVVREEVHSRRFGYVRELWRMGADITVEGRVAVVRGVEQLAGAQVVATDLRGGAALVLAALAARGESVIAGLSHLQRGYERLPAKLAALGARVELEAPEGAGVR